jgi:hypothetical protein
MSDVARELLRKLLAQVDRGGRTTLPITPRYAKRYFVDDSLEARKAIHADLLNAQQAEGILLEWDTGAASQDLLRLRLKDADKLAAWLGVSRAESHASVMAETLAPLLCDAPDWLRQAYEESLQRWKLGKPALRVNHDDPEGAEILFRIALAVSRGEQVDLDLRRFSVQLLGDSKAVESRLRRLAILLRRNPEWGDLEENAELFRTLGLEKFPPPLFLKGPTRIEYGGTGWDISDLRPFVGLSPDCVRAFQPTRPIPYLLTIENLASFQRHAREINDDGIVIYTAGFPAPALVQVLEQLDASLPPSCPFFHWGDRDLGGLRIFAKIENAYRSHRLRPHLMSRGLAESDPFPGETHRKLCQCANADTAAGALAKIWCDDPALGTLEQECIDPMPPGKQGT